MPQGRRVIGILSHICSILEVLGLSIPGVTVSQGLWVPQAHKLESRGEVKGRKSYIPGQDALWEVGFQVEQSKSVKWHQ